MRRPAYTEKNARRGGGLITRRQVVAGACSLPVIVGASALLSNLGGGDLPNSNERPVEVAGASVRVHGSAALDVLTWDGSTVLRADDANLQSFAVEPGGVSYLSIESSDPYVCTFRDMDGEYECESRRYGSVGQSGLWVTWVPGVDKLVDIWAGQEPPFEIIGVI